MYVTNRHSHSAERIYKVISRTVYVSRIINRITQRKEPLRCFNVSACHFPALFGHPGMHTHLFCPFSLAALQFVPWASGDVILRSVRWFLFILIESSLDSLECKDASPARAADISMPGSENLRTHALQKVFGQWDFWWWRKVGALATTECKCSSKSRSNSSLSLKTRSPLLWILSIRTRMFDRLTSFKIW